MTDASAPNAVTASGAPEISTMPAKTTATPMRRRTSGRSPQIAQAQNFGQRTLQGKVIDDREAPVGGATIFLKNLKTRDVKSFTSTPDGSFRFAQVGMVDDYEVWAEQGKKKSSVKTISSFDSRKQLDFDLKLK